MQVKWNGVALPCCRREADAEEIVQQAVAVENPGENENINRKQAETRVWRSEAD